MRVHRKHRAKQESLPGKLRSVVQPTAQDENEQVARLNQHVEWRSAFPSDAWRVVDSHGQQKYRVPPQNARPDKVKESDHERDLHYRDAPLQSHELVARAPRSE